jgi:putative transposase
MELVYRFKYHEKNKIFDELCRVSNNLYNQALYKVLMRFKETNKWLRYNELDKIMKLEKNLEDSINYRLLKPQVSQQILRQLDKDWISYFRAIKAYKKDKTGFSGMPKRPNFKKKNDRFLLKYPNQSCQIKGNKLILEKDVIIDIPETDIDFTKFQQVRVLPRNTFYWVEIVYKKDCVNSDLNQENYFSIDLGTNNLATCISKDKSFILSGQEIKSVNQYYNKQKAGYQYFREKNSYNEFSSKFNQLCNYRSDFIKDQLHKMTRFIVNYCLEKKIGTIVCGYNKLWKDSIDIGKVNNQNFTYIPYGDFIKYLQYKCDLVGIELICNEESYTSKCDGLALEPVEKHKKYLGKRIHRGLFQSSVGKLINADVNGALNILRKVIGDSSFIKEITDSVVLFNPVKIRFSDLSDKQTLSNLLVQC